MRLKEWVTKPFFHHYFLAEQGYQQEFTFYKPNYTVLQNTFSPTIANKANIFSIKRGVTLVLTGTLAEHYGTLDAIRLVKNISKGIDIHLNIVGYAPNKEFLENLLSEISGNNRFSLIGGDSFVPHEVIVSAITQADAGIIPYPRHIATENKLPTRIFEYLAHQLPILISPLPYWIQYCKPFKAAIPVDFANDNQEGAIKKLLEGGFYPHGAPKEAFWSQYDEPKLIKVINKLIQPNYHNIK
ncbi:MAG: hypothetical protein AAFQ98_21335 [Bacteroidota bacterium]